MVLQFTEDGLLRLLRVVLREHDDHRRALGDGQLFPPIRHLLDHLVRLPVSLRRPRIHKHNALFHHAMFVAHLLHVRDHVVGVLSHKGRVVGDDVLL